MTYTIRDNNGNEIFSIENTNSITPEVSYESINNEIKDIEEYGNKLDKSIEAYNLISDTRAMEALGYVKGAGFKDNIKAVSHEILEKIKKFFGNIKQIFVNLGNWIAGIFNKIKSHFDEKKAKEGAKILSNACNNAKTVDEVAEKVVEESAKSVPQNTVKGKIIRLALEDKRVDRSVLMLEDNREETRKYNNDKEYEQAALAKYERLREQEKERIQREKEELNDKLNRLLSSPDFIEWTIHHSERESLNSDDHNIRNFADFGDIDYVTHGIRLLRSYIKNVETNSFEENKDLIDSISNYSDEAKKRIDAYNSNKDKSSMTTDKMIFNLKLIMKGDVYSVSNFKYISDSANYVIQKATSYADECVNIMNKLINDKETNISKEIVLNLVGPIQQYLRIYVTTVKAEVHSITMAMPVIASIANIPKSFYGMPEND